MKNKYRIITDRWLGYEAQVKLWWMPFMWFQLSRYGGLGTNTSPDMERAMICIERHKNKYKKPSRVIWSDEKKDPIDEIKEIL